jgi:hypothetical protein
MIPYHFPIFTQPITVHDVLPAFSVRSHREPYPYLPESLKIPWSRFNRIVAISVTPSTLRSSSFWQILLKRMAPRTHSSLRPPICSACSPKHPYMPRNNIGHVERGEGGAIRWLFSHLPEEAAFGIYSDINSIPHMGCKWEENEPVLCPRISKGRSAGIELLDDMQAYPGQLCIWNFPYVFL